MILKEVMSSDKLQDIVTKGEEKERKIFEKEGHDDFEVEHFEVNAKTPIYEIVFSNKAKKQEFIDGYVKFDLDELGLPEDCKLYDYQPYSRYVSWYSTVDDWSRDNSISIRKDDTKSYYWFQLNSN